MLSRAFALGLFALCSSASAQQPATGGPLIGFGNASPEAMTLDFTQPFASLGYETATGWSVSALGSVQSEDRLEFYAESREILAREFTSSSYRAGLAAAKDTPTRVGTVRIGVTAIYGQDDYRSIGFSLQDQLIYGEPSPVPTDTLQTLGAEPGTRTQHSDSRLHLASGVSLRYPLGVGSRLSLAPGVGVALGTQQSLDGTDLYIGSRGAAYVQLPVRFAVTERVGATLDFAVGGTASRLTSFWRQFSGGAFRFAPHVSTTARLDF